jgi:cell division protein FtsA
LPAGVVLTGGTGQTRGLVELAREVFAMPARIGQPTRGVSGLVDSVNAPRYAVPVGLVYYAAEEGLRAGAGKGVNQVIGRAKRWLQELF